MHKVGEKDEINDSFPSEHVLAASQDLIPRFADFVNYFGSDIDPLDLSFHQRKKFMYDVKRLFWDEPYLYRCCVDWILRCCVLELEMLSVWRNVTPCLWEVTIVVS